MLVFDVSPAEVLAGKGSGADIAGEGDVMFGLNVQCGMALEVFL